MGDSVVINAKKRRKLDEAVIRITMKDINSEMTCRVCLGIIRNATTVMECLHRFCEECIGKSLRMGRKQCPSCRVSCPSRRNLRRDLQFDEVIRQFYPDLNAIDAQQEAIVQKIVNSQEVKAFASSIHTGEEKQKVQAKKRIRSRGSDKKKKSGKNQTIALMLRKHPVLDAKFKLKATYLCVVRHCRVETLANYLHSKLLPPQGTKFSFTIMTDYQKVPLLHVLSLDEVEDKYWNQPNNALVLTYNVEKEDSSKEDEPLSSSLSTLDTPPTSIPTREPEEIRPPTSITPTAATVDFFEDQSDKAVSLTN